MRGYNHRRTVKCLHQMDEVVLTIVAEVVVVVAVVITVVAVAVVIVGMMIPVGPVAVVSRTAVVGAEVAVAAIAPLKVNTPTVGVQSETPQTE